MHNWVGLMDIERYSVGLLTGCGVGKALAKCRIVRVGSS